LDKELDLLEKKVRKKVRKLNDLAQPYLNEATVRFLEDKLEREYGIKGSGQELTSAYFSLLLNTRWHLQHSPPHPLILLPLLRLASSFTAGAFRRDPRLPHILL